MKKKNIFVLLGVFVALVLAALFMEGMGKRGERKADKESIIFPNFSPDRVSSIELKTKDKKVKLSKEGDIWLVSTADNYPADKNAVKAMLDKTKELKSSIIASKSADKHSQFQVDEASGVGVAMLGPNIGEVVAHFFVGKMGPDYMSTYIRRADQDNVLLVDGYLKSIFDKGLRGWRDRTIFDFDSQQVQKLTLISQEKGSIVISANKDGGWQIIDPEAVPAKKNAVDEIINSISKLSADGFAREEQIDTEAGTEQAPGLLEKSKLDAPQSKIMVDLKDGSVRVLLVGDKLGQDYYVKREEKDAIFMLSASKIDRIFKDLADLKADEEEAAAEQAPETP